MVGISGEKLTQAEQSIIRQFPFGGFILFGRNCCEPAQIVSLCHSLWATGKAYPPFIAIDQEGGRVHRVPKPFTHFPAASRVGQRGDLNLAYRAGRATAGELASAGINLNFAPVLDVHSNPQNLIIGDRSFGTDPTNVSKFGGQWMQGLRDGGIIPCGKHFPGHGDTDKDSHLDLPVVEKSLEKLKGTELPPFIHVCHKQIESLMTSHVIYRALDSKLPATLSRPIITGLLRKDLGYEGVVFGDDMDMKAISDNYGPDEAVSLSVWAGADMLLYGHDLTKAVHAFEFLRSEADKDPAIRVRVENNYRRIEKLKRRRLKTFTGVGGKELVARLARLGHQRLVDAIHGNL